MPIEEGQPSMGGVKAWATWGLSLTILLVSILAFLELEEVVTALGLIPAEVDRMGGLTLVTAFFIHGGAFQLIGNLYFLLIFGDNVEHFLGPIKFLFLIAAASLGGDLLHILIDPDSQVPCIGASGGISGVLAFYALKFPKAKLTVLLYYFRGGFLRLGAAWMFALWITQQCFILWQQSMGFSSVSAAAHLGGAFVGALFWFLTNRKKRLTVDRLR